MGPSLLIAIAIASGFLGGVVARSGFDEKIEQHLQDTVVRRLAALELQVGTLNRVADSGSAVRAKEGGTEDLGMRVGFLERRMASATDRLERAHRRLSETRLVTVEETTGAPYGCGGNDRKDGSYVMVGLRDGAGCGSQNLNYYRKLSLAIPPP